MCSPLLSFQLVYEILAYYRFVVIFMGVNTFYYVIYGHGMFVNNETTSYETYSSSSGNAINILSYQPKKVYRKWYTFFYKEALNNLKSLAALYVIVPV